MKIITTSITFLFIALISLAQTNDPKAEAVLNKLSEKAKTYKTVEAVFTFTQHDKKADETSVQKGSVKVKDEKYVLGTLKSIIGDNDKYRADIASTISTRLVNYLERYATDNKVEKITIERIKALVKSDIFTKDIMFNMVKGIYNANTKKYQMMLMDKELSQLILK